MITLYHHPFCPHSRFVRLALGEHGLEPKLIEERVWDRRREFLLFCPEGATPVMIEDDGPILCGADVIAEYLDETLGLDLADRRLMPEDPVGRAEVRRLTRWHPSVSSWAGPVRGCQLSRCTRWAQLGMPLAPASPREPRRAWSRR